MEQKAKTASLRSRFKEYMTDSEPGIVADLRAFFLTDAPEPPSNAVLAARRKLARALLVVASKVKPKD